MEFEKWEPRYLAVTKDLGYSTDADRKDNQSPPGRSEDASA